MKPPTFVSICALACIWSLAVGRRSFHLMWMYVDVLNVSQCVIMFPRWRILNSQARAPHFDCQHFSPSRFFLAMSQPWSNTGAISFRSSTRIAPVAWPWMSWKKLDMCWSQALMWSGRLEGFDGTWIGCAIGRVKCWRKKSFGTHPLLERKGHLQPSSGRSSGG